MICKKKTKWQYLIVWILKLEISLDRSIWLWCTHIIESKINVKKLTSDYVATVSIGIHNYFDPDCSRFVLILIKLISRFRRNPGNREQSLWVYWHKHDSKKVFNLKFLKYCSGIWWCCIWIFFLRFNSFNSFWFARIF